MLYRERAVAGQSAAPDGDAQLAAMVSGVESLVSRGVPSATVYQAVVDGALGLLDGDSGSLRFVDAEDPTWMVAVAWRGAAGQEERWRHRAPITEGVSGRVISTGEPVAVEHYEHAARGGSQLAPPGTKAMLGIPIRELGLVVGSLLVGSTVADRRWTGRERDLLVAYAERLAVALSVTAARQAVQQAFSDPLTNLGNRRQLLDRLGHELVRSDRGGEPPTVLFVDLDGFKQVNDSLGHLVGDQLLIAVAGRLRGCVRDADTSARVGGDEFAILLAAGSDPVAVAERIVTAMQTGFQIAEHEVFLGASVGIATGGDEAETLLRNADLAMYEAKSAGGGCYKRFASPLHAALVSRLGLETELRGAIARGEFGLHYQPILDLRSGEITGFEGLLRWHHPSLGLVGPLEFLPLAEQTGMIVEIGRRVLLQGCSQLAAWRRLTPLALSLNVSSRELALRGYAAAVEAAIDGAFPPSALILEVSERAPLQDTPRVVDSLHALKQLGVRIALDDFGTGYSSLLNLSRIPVDVLKIGKPFLDAIDVDQRHAPLLAAAIAVGRHLGLLTIAAGIERPDQRARVTQLGCDLGQGYLLGHPLDTTTATELLREQSMPRPTRQT
jgi:diguanylate cyclase (GGDEF)-like protein